MSLIKQTNAEILRDSWPNQNAIPQPLIDLDNAGTIDVNLIGVLLAIGVFTRPPATMGFHLSDLWAWVRYISAFSTMRSLGMRREWSSIDWHHKTVASGDFGVGFSTWILSGLLGFWDCVDVLHVVNVLEPNRYILGSNASRGPGKSPDYVAYGPGHQISVLECKGTQTSASYLRGALRDGISQKANLQVAGAAGFSHSLVSGIFVPQGNLTSRAVFMVCDPPGDGLKSKLSEYSPRQINEASSRASLARDLAHFGLAQSVDTLLGTNEGSNTMLDSIDADFRERPRQRERITAEFDYSLPENIAHGEIAIEGVSFKAELPEAIIESLRVDASPDELAPELWDSRSRHQRRMEADETAARFVSPNGIEFSLVLQA